MARQFARLTLLRSVALGAVGIASCPAIAGDAPLSPAELVTSSATVQLIDKSRLGCGEGMAPWANLNGDGRCAFDSTTRGARITERHEFDGGEIIAYATVARSVSGYWTPEQLLTPEGHRESSDTNFFLVGFKGQAFDNRLKLTTELSWTDSVVARIRETDWRPQDESLHGSSARVRMDLKLVDSPQASWSVSGEYRAVSDEYVAPRSQALMQAGAIPGSKLALATTGRIGTIRLSAALDQVGGPFGSSLTRRADIDVNGIFLRLSQRRSHLEDFNGMAFDSRTRSRGANLDLDLDQIAMSLLPALGERPHFMPSTLSLSYRESETESRSLATSNRYRRASLGVDALWDTPLGETSLNYWQDRKTGLSEGALSSRSSSIQLGHSFRRGNWRFGADAALSRYESDGVGTSRERSFSFGQSIAYSTPGGPEFRLSMSQDRGQTQTGGDAYLSDDRYSTITASLDLSRYLQERFERPDLRLTLDYRKAAERSGGEMFLEDELIDRWVEGDHREGFLISFGLKL